MSTEPLAPTLPEEHHEVDDPLPPTLPEEHREVDDPLPPTLPEEHREVDGSPAPTVPEEHREERAVRHEGPPDAHLVSVGPSRYADCLDVLRAGFGTEVGAYRITVENNPHYPVYWDDSVIPGLVARGFQLFAIEADGRILGCAFAGPSRSRPGTWELRHLAVHPDGRHRGYGEVLVTEAARRAQRAGATVLRIGIVAENVRLSQWYRQLGFVTTEAGIRYASLPFTVDHLELAVTSLCIMSTNG